MLHFQFETKYCQILQEEIMDEKQTNITKQKQKEAHSSLRSTEIISERILLSVVSYQGEIHDNIFARIFCLLFY